MIILKLNEDVNEKKKKMWWKSKAKDDLLKYSRAGLIIYNKPHFIISVNESCLYEEQFKKMLERYKGEIITSEKLSKNEFINELVFDEKPFLKKAIFKSFCELLKKYKSKSLNVFIADIDFVLKEELPQILPYVKTLTVKVEDEIYIRDWQRQCFLEYGIKPQVITGGNFSILNYDVVADFDMVQNKSLKIEFEGEYKTLFSDNRLLSVPEELKFLENFELENSTICAAFGSHNK